MSEMVQLPISVGLGDMAVHVEVPRDLGQGEFSPFQLRSQYNLAAQPGVLLEEGGHVQHVVLPGQGGQQLVVGTWVELTRAQKAGGEHLSGHEEAG